MSNPHLPPEILDYIVDHLHDTKEALRNCCLASKSWIPRTRIHLFAVIVFLTSGRLQSWTETFPDPSTSPAHYAKTLYVSSSEVVTAAGVEAGGRIRDFSRVEHLELGTQRNELRLRRLATPLVLFHELSPAIKSLCVAVLRPSALADFQPSPFIPSPRRLNCGCLRRDDGGRQRWFWRGSYAVRRPTLDPTQCLLDLSSSSYGEE
jgi:hypothetical protein